MAPKGQRQTLMFSATFPEAIRNVAKEFLNNYLFLRFFLLEIMILWPVMNLFILAWEWSGELAQMWTNILMR